MRRRTRRHSERGVYLVLMSVFAFALMGMFALAIGLGFVATSKSTMLNVANLSALAALESYFEQHPECDGDALPEGVTEEDCRREQALERAAEIAASNRVPGTSRPFELGDIKLDFGIWFNEEPENGDPACTVGTPPCFEPVDEQTGANAVRLGLETQPDNPILSFFTGIFRVSEFHLDVETTSTVVPRCAAFLGDASLSTTGDNYTLYRNFTYEEPLPPAPAPLFYVTEPAAGAGLWALLQDGIRHSSGTLRNCRTVTGYQPEGGPGAFPDEIVSWCDYNYDLESDDVTRRDRCSADPLEARCAFGFFQSDYGVSSMSTLPNPSPYSGTYPVIVPDVFGSPYGNVLLNRYRKPQPLSSFMLGFNAAVREVQNKSTDVDRAMIAVFSGAINLNPDPGSGLAKIERLYPLTGLTKNIGFMVQLTNYDNIGAVDDQGVEISEPLHPNFVDKGFFPLLFSDEQGLTSFTNIAGALLFTIDRLYKECPSNSRKIIILATDGIGNCTSTEQAMLNPQAGDPECHADYVAGYLGSETLLLDHVLAELIRREVSLVTLFGGSYVRPNIKNIVNPTLPEPVQNACKLGTAGDEFDCYLSTMEAAALGMGGSTGGGGSCGESSIVSCDSSGGSHETAYNNLGQPGVYFGPSIGTMAELSLKSGGELCNLYSLFDSANPAAFVDDYVQEDGAPCTVEKFNQQPFCKLRNSERSGTIATMPLIFAGTGTQAADCAARYVGQNPYVLVSPRD